MADSPLDCDKFRLKQVHRNQKKVKGHPELATRNWTRQLLVV